MSMGSRQTRRRRRARRRRARLKGLANTILLQLIAGVHALFRGVGWNILFFALMFSLTGAVVSVLAGETAFAILLTLSSLFLFAALWIRGGE